MVDLPKVPRRLVTAEEPRSGLSGRDIAAPYATLAQAFGDVGTALTDIADAHVEDVAARSVTIGPDGQPRVEPSAIPMVGKTGRAYDRHVRMGVVAAADSASDKDLIEMREQHRDNPGAFRAAAEAYRDQRVGQVGTEVGPAAAQALRRQIDNRITSTFGGLLSEHQNKSIARANNAIDARISTLGDEMETLARRNGIIGENGEPTPEYADRLGNIRTLLEEKVNNPLSTFTREQAGAYLDKLNTRVQGAAIHEQMERIYRGEASVNGRSGFEAARDYLKGASRGLDGKVKEVDKIERAGLAWLRSEEAGFRGERDAISREWAAARGQASTLPRESLIELEQRASALGAHRVASDIATTRAALDINAEIRALPLPEQAAIARSGSVNLVDRIVRAESGGNPNARATTSSATGAGQFIRSTWLDMVRRHRPDIAQGKTEAEILALRTNPELSREMVGRYAQENGQKLSAAGVQVNDGALYLAHFLGPGDAIKVLSAAPGTPLTGLVNQASIDANRSIFDRNPTAGQLQQWASGKVGGGGAAATGTDLTSSRAGLTALGMLKRDLARDFGARITAVNDRVRAGQIPSAEDVAALGEMATVVGTPQQRRQVAEIGAMAELGERFQQLSGPERDAAIAAFDEKLKAGGSQVDSDLVATLRAADRAIGDMYKSDPYGAFARYGRHEAAQATPPMDFGNPVEAAAISNVRVKQQAIIRGTEGLGPFSVMRPSEREAFRGVMASGDARQVSAAMGVLNTLPEEVLAATLKDDTVKAGIVGAIHSDDPAKVNAVMANLDTWYRRDPQAFNARFGSEAWNALKTWQSNLRYLTPEQFAEQQRKALDPGQAEIRRKNTSKGEEEARKVTPQQVVDSMGSFFSSSLLGTAPEVPTDPQVRDLLMADYVSVYARRFAETLDKDTANTQAAELLSQKWTRSPLNSSEMMLRAPETIYPAVAGTHDYLAPQIEAAVSERLGIPRRQTVPNLAPGMQGSQVTLGLGPTNFDYRIVADTTTEQEAQRYDRRLPASETNKPPSYQVIVRDNRRQNPRWEPMAGRFAFDPNAPQETARQRVIDRMPIVDGGGGY